MGNEGELTIKPNVASACVSRVIENFLDFGGSLDSKRDLPHELPSVLIGMLVTVLLSTIPYFTDTSILFYLLAVIIGIITWL